ncbi:T9SS type A sorting domain-containing protein [Runella sp. SP2]|uniref:T9SS type A sorting domain-containing protein n=1 Tax=Runella sp. SP2 TaxID=2268026 RepID=UPI0013DE14BE|nr:T9SS type A sorting domain-containing protein [Runella sp. SP2]
MPKLYRQPKFVLLLLVLLFGVLVAGCWYGYQKQLKNFEKQLYDLQHKMQTQRFMNSKLLLFTLLLCICSFGLLAQVTPQGSLSGNAICPGAQATLTFTATAGTGPFTVRYTDGNAIRTQTGVTSGTPFNAISKTTTTKTYTLLKVTGADGGTRSSGFTDATGTVTVSPRPDLKGLTLSPIAPVCAGSNASLSLSGFEQTRSFQPKPPISTLTNGALSVYSADLDGDGDMDVLSASVTDDKIAWYKNDGSGGFGPQIIISTSADFPTSIHAADLDGDGDLDVLSASIYDDKIAWYQNNGSSGFGPQNVISNSANDANSVYAADLDGDGDMDVLSASINDSKIAWYENNGSGAFGPQTVISTAGSRAQSVYAADLDGDGDMDVLSASSNDDKIAWYQNNGSGGFGPQNTISTETDGAAFVTAADLDGDGDMDVLSASQNDNKVAWYENNGSGGFGAQNIISTSAGGTASVHAADLDGDGDLDVLSASGLDNKVAWYENNGSGGFGSQTVISNTTGFAYSVYAADLDGDGDMDVPVAAYHGDRIVWFENRTPLGSNNATVTYTIGGGIPQTVTVPVSAGSASLTLTAPKAGLLTLLKISNGGPCATSTGKTTQLRHLPRPDLKDLTLGTIAPVCAGSNATLPLSGFVQTQSFQSKPSISTVANAAISVYAADLDGDGDMDVLSASLGDDKIAWYKNDGSGGFGAQQVISTSANGAASVYAADLDGDGDLDVLSASSNDDKIAWYKNDGSGGFGAQQVISTSANGAVSVYAADLDGDGDMDVLSASLDDDKIAWYKNDSSGGFGAQQVISTVNGAAKVYAADLDGDGDLDVLSASVVDDKIAWYKNDGSGGFGAQQVISTVNRAVSVYAADLDGDGDMDVLSASLDDDKIAWYQNNGSGTFTAQPSITTSADVAESVYAADLDGDGDIDVLSASSNDDKIAWYKNDGGGTFTTQTSISTSASSARSVYAADLDGDGDMDVLSASVNDNKIAWYENRTPLSGNAQVIYTINGGSTQTAPITVSSGSASAVIASPVSGTLQLSKITASSGCETAVSSSTSLSIDPVSVGGVVSAPQTICTNTSPVDLTLSGQVGNVVRWEKSVNHSFSSPTPISSTSVTLTSAIIGNLTADTYFRAVVKSGVCSEATSSSVLITVNLLPTASISGTTTVCRNTPSPTITFTGANATAPYTFTYKINDGAPQTVTTTSGNSVTVAAPTGTAGTFVYSLISVLESSTTACSQTQTGSATVTVNPLPTATISGTTTVCRNSPSPSITFTGSNATAPYTFTYKINDGPAQTVTTTSGNSATVAAPTGTAGTFVYSLISVSESSTTSCSQEQSGSATVTVNPLPTATISGTTTVCRNSPSPSITFTGSNATAPYTFTYKINDGAPQTVTTTSGNSVTVAAPTGTAGTFEYSLISVLESSTTACSQTQTGSAMVTVNPLPTATISGTTTVCRNSPSPNITFTGSNATAPYTFTYKINDGAPQTVTTTGGNSVTVAVPTVTAGTFVYSLVSVSESSTTSCSQEQSGSATVKVNPLPTATISGTTTVCRNSASPMITFTGANAAAPYTFTYKINDGAPQTVTTTGGNSVTVAAPTGTAGTFVYSLISVSESSTTSCSQEQSGSVEVRVQGKPTITLTTLQQTLNEGNSQTFCDTDANPVNGLQFNVSGSCVVGNPVWRVQVGSGAWSDWSPNAPVSQSSNNQPYRYQAACDASCPVTYTNPIELTINYRASTPQNVSLVVDGVTVNVGETKEVCNIEGNGITFNATCGAGEILLYSVDGAEYSSTLPVQLVDGQYHNYRVRCRKSDGTVSCVETESGVMRLRIVSSSLVAPVASLNVTSGCGSPVAFSGITNCGALTTIWYNAVTNVALPSLPNQTPTETTSYYARCQAGGGCLSEKSNVVTYTVIPVGVAPAITVSQDIVCTGTTVTISANCPAGSQTFWNTGVTTSSFEVSFSNVTKQSYWAKCVFSGGCQSAESVRKDVYWNAFVVTLINIGESKSAIKTNDRSAWTSQFITRDGGPELEQSTQVNPTLYFAENVNKTAPRYWTVNVEACGLSNDGSLTFDMLATPETGVIRSFNTHENNAPYFMYANRDGWTELYGQNHPAYGFYQDNGVGSNVYDAGLPKGLYKLGIRYWDQKGWGSIYPSTRKPQGNVLAYQEYWFRIQSRNGVGVGAARSAEQVASGQMARGEGQESNGKEQGSDNGKQITDNGTFATVLPNPVSNILRLKVQNSKGQVVQTSLTDASGREVLRRQFVPETNTHQEEFGVSELPTAIYFLKVTTETQQATLKVVKAP